MTDKSKSYIHCLDATGLTCPEPVMLLHGVVRDAQGGDCIKVIATDPSAERDIAKFCRFLGHDLLEFKHEDGVLEFLIRKGKA